MSMGYGGKAVCVSEDERDITYEYGSYNLNLKDKSFDVVLDGIIIIQKKCFDEAESKSYEELTAEGKILVQNCSNCWKTYGDQEVDAIANHMLFKLFSEYKKNKKILEEISLHF